MEFKLPDVGEGTTEGEIVRWLVEVGQRVTLDQALVEIETDKAVVELPSPRAGVIVKRLGEEGEVVPVGATLVVIEDDPGQAQAGIRRSLEVEATGVGTPDGPEAAARRKDAQSVQAAPYTRKIARESGVALETLVGSGPKGRIVPQDVRQALGTTKASPGLGTGSGGPTNVQEIPMRGLRKSVADHLSQTWRDVPQVSVVEKYDFSDLVRLRQELKEAPEASGVRLTYLAFLIKALTRALEQYPDFNARWQGERLFRHSTVDIGIAVHSEQGLAVPVVRGADQLSLLEISREVERLAKGARQRSLKPEELTGSTITVTAGGALGGLFATPIIHSPEVAIIGMYRIQLEPIIRDGAVVAASVGYLSLTFDHRAVDGMAASGFLNALGEALSQPTRWLLNLS